MMSIRYIRIGHYRYLLSENSSGTVRHKTSHLIPTCYVPNVSFRNILINFKDFQFMIRVKYRQGTYVE